MGLSWQQGPLGSKPSGTFITATPMPERVLYLEPLRRRMRVELGGGTVARSDDAMVLLSVDEVGGIQLAEVPSSAGARA